MGATPVVVLLSAAVEAGNLQKLKQQRRVSGRLLVNAESEAHSQLHADHAGILKSL